jgi:hypothetical protein
MSNDYTDFEKEERTSKRLKKKNGYEIQHLECCLTCKLSSQSPEDDLRCSKIPVGIYYIFNDVSPLGICDFYE